MTLRWIAAGLLLGALPALVVWAPANWMALAVQRASAGRVLLADAEGTVWAGSALLALTGGADSRDATTLPGRLSWRLGLEQGLPALWLQQACCMQAPLRVQWQPGWSRQRIHLHPGAGEAAHTAVAAGVAGAADAADAADAAGAAGAVAAVNAAASTWGQWPMSLLSGLGSPWNTLRPSGTLQLSSQQLELQLENRQLVLQGQLDLLLSGVASGVSTLDTLGDYRLQLSAPAGSPAASVQLQTLRGPLQLQGNGLWSAQGLRFNGQASAAPGSEAALNNLLNIIGQRQGAVTLLSIG